jgi:RNA-binding protein YhbY
MKSQQAVTKVIQYIGTPIVIFRERERERERESSFLHDILK